MPDDMRPRPSAHFTPPWSTVKNVASRSLMPRDIGQQVVFYQLDTDELPVSGILEDIRVFPEASAVMQLTVDGQQWLIRSDIDVSVFYNFDGETAGNPEYVRGIGVLLLWGVITGLIALAVVVTLWKWS